MLKWNANLINSLFTFTVMPIVVMWVINSVTKSLYYFKYCLVFHEYYSIIVY